MRSLKVFGMSVQVLFSAVAGLGSGGGGGGAGARTRAAREDRGGRGFGCVGGRHWLRWMVK